MPELDVDDLVDLAHADILHPDAELLAEDEDLREMQTEDGEEGEGDAGDEEPLYVNAKQYHRILKRRLARARLEELNRLSRSRKVSFPRDSFGDIC